MAKQAKDRKFLRKIHFALLRASLRRLRFLPSKTFSKSCSFKNPYLKKLFYQSNER
jgi:hypothetical protein